MVEKVGKNLNICIVHEEYPNETSFGGIATYQKILAENLKKMGHNVFVICRSYKQSSHYYENGVSIYRIKTKYNNNSLESILEYRKKVKECIEFLEESYGLDMIETPEWGANCIEYLKKDDRKTPVVTKLHTPLIIWEEYNKSSFAKEIRENILNAERDSILLSDGVISCTHDLIEKVKKQMNIDRNIKVMPNPAEIKELSHEKFNNKSDEPIIITYVGSMEERKGIFLLANAINIVLKKINDRLIEFRFIGRDTNRNSFNKPSSEVIKNIIEPRFINNVKIIGFIENHKVIDYMDDSDIMVFPSLYENFPYVVLEAMSRGKPIIGSSSGGMKEIFVDKESGLLFNPPNINELANKIIYLIKNEKEREKLGANAINQVKKFSAKNVLPKQILYYESVIEKFCQASVKMSY